MVGGSIDGQREPLLCLGRDHPRLGSTRWRVFALSGLSLVQCTGAIWMCSMAMREVAEFNGC